MRRLSTLFFCLLFACSFAHAQYIVKGVVTDTLNNTQLYMSSVVLIRTSDSVIETFARSGYNGQVELHVAKEGKYVLRVTYRGFADYVDVINVKGPTTDLGIIPMLSKEHLLKEFVITRNIAAIKIKGDTTEYIADSFKTKANATVEDLLKKLPGIQVDKNGQIVAQGETVAKILVDGEEFFSDDPKVITKGLQAKAVDKVQVFDKKSDQAEFTGIDDGQKTKTINLELKEEYKKGYFGKVDAGGGTDGYFQNQAMINAFKSKRQLSAFGIASNTDKVGLGWQDNDKYSSGNGNTEITDDGGVITTYTGNSDEDFGGWNGKYNGEGLPKTWTAGLHYADKWNQDKDHLSANYRYALQNVEVGGNTTIQNLPYYTQETSKTQFSKSDRHAADGTLEWKIDSNTTVKLTANGGIKDMETYSLYKAEVKNEGRDSTTNNDRSIRSNAKSQFINADLLLKKKFAKKGRTLSVDIKENDKETSSTGYLNSVSYSNLTSYTSSINQRKENKSNTLAFSAKGTYTEPLSKQIFMEANYGITINNIYSKNFSFDTAISNDQPVSNVSSEYKYNILTNRGGLNFKYVVKKVTFAIGSDISNTQYAQTDVIRHDSVMNRSYLNIFPSALLTYKIGKQTSLNIHYQGNSRQPTISQIQPLTQNTDPFNITIGNPHLKQEFTNSVNLHFNDYKVLTNRYTWASISFTSTSDAISTSQRITNGIDTIQYVNVNGNYSMYSYLGGGVKLGKGNFYLGGQLTNTLSHVNNFINGAANVSNSNTYGISPYLNFEKEDKFEFSVNPGFTYNHTKNTLSKLVDYYVFNTDFSGTVTLPKKFEIGSSVDVMIRQPTEVFTSNNNVVKWNAHVSKKFLKKSQLEVRLSVYDLLNQNIGFDRSTSSNGIITENRYNTIRRYGMLNLIWNFTKTPTGNAPEPNIQIMK